jgi:hypothetical protein
MIILIVLSVLYDSHRLDCSYISQDEFRKLG